MTGDTKCRLGLLLSGVLALLALACAPKTDVSNPVAARFRGVDALVAIDELIAEHPVDKDSPGWKTRVPRPPFVQFSPDKTYYWVLNTSEGLIKIRLLPEYAPRHVSTTIYLTRLGFYDDLGFHRIVPGFMAQGGDPLGSGRGSPGFRYAGEFHKKAKHDQRGIVSSANSGPRTDGSQFFILFKEVPDLDGKHTVFGEVVEGMGTLRTVERYGTKSGEPRKPVVIRRAEILVE